MNTDFLVCLFWFVLLFEGADGPQPRDGAARGAGRQGLRDRRLTVITIIKLYYYYYHFWSIIIIIIITITIIIIIDPFLLLLLLLP